MRRREREIEKEREGGEEGGLTLPAKEKHALIGERDSAR